MTETVATQAPAPWMVLCPPGMVLVDALDGRRRRRALGTLASGDRIGLTANRPLSRWRLRRIAATTGLLIERELIVLPTLSRPILVVDDKDTSVDYLWGSVATVPPGLAWTAVPAAIALRLARMLPWSWTGAVAPGRVVIGRLP